ncbi:hypothetical protein N7454_002500 [Penicillium verhagenii]|nr:hypothetical protein N7454_002500 [Penicillium verhagenii]
MSTAQPEVTWAQRSSADQADRNYLYVSIKAAEVPKEEAKLELTATNVSFTGASRKGVTYKTSLDLFGEIDTENSKVNHTDREVELVLRKKELKEEFWPRLLKEAKKVHFLKTDFDKWVDEDEQDEAPEDDYANNFGGMGGGGEGEGAGGGLGNIDFSKLGGMMGGEGGMPDLSSMMGGGGMPDLSALAGGAGGFGAEGADDEEDDDELPELEDEQSSKIQEIS